MIIDNLSETTKTLVKQFKIMYDEKIILPKSTKIEPKPMVKI